jgi:hypothetical protein
MQRAREGVLFEELRRAFYLKPHESTKVIAAKRDITHKIEQTEGREICFVPFVLIYYRGASGPTLNLER